MKPVKSELDPKLATHQEEVHPRLRRDLRPRSEKKSESVSPGEGRRPFRRDASNTVRVGLNTPFEFCVKLAKNILYGGKYDKVEFQSTSKVGS